MNDGDLPNYLMCQSGQYGELEKAGAFVYREFEPLDEPTTEYVENLLSELGIIPKGPANQRKYVRCLSDFLMAVRTTLNSRIAWAAGSDEYVGPPYGADIARTVRRALIIKEYLVLVQKSSKRDRLARLYDVSKHGCPSYLRFRHHGEGPLVEVRSPKKREGGTVIGGTRMGRKQFLPEIKTLEGQVAQINAKMLSEPLCEGNGVQHVRVYRIFNNGSLKAGGRLYGRWQTLPEEERLATTIGGEGVCEIDVKASFLSIAAGSTKHNQVLASDPYLMVPFVRGAEDQQAMRKVAKLLVNAYLCKEGEMVQFPRGEKKKGEEKVISFAKRHGLQHNVQYYMDQIHITFPFLRRLKLDGLSLMYKESQIMIGAMQALLQQGIVSYPIHDCLLVKKSDQEEAIAALQVSLSKHLSQIPTMDVSWLEEGEMKTHLVESKGSQDHLPFDLSYHEDSAEDDFDVLEDFPIPEGRCLGEEGLSI